MEIVRIQEDNIKNKLMGLNFFRENDYLFIDPFENHVDIAEYFEKLLKYGIVLCAVLNNEPVGIACAYINDAIGKMAHLQVLVVNSGKQRLGIGKELCQAIHCYAKKNGMNKCILTIDKGNFAAEKLYKNLGYFDAVEEHENTKKKYMIKILDENDYEKN